MEQPCTGAVITVVLTVMGPPGARGCAIESRELTAVGTALRRVDPPSLPARTTCARAMVLRL
jgi:hypothetical protein